MIADNLRKIRQKIALICQHTGRNLSEITLVAVTKSASPEQIQEVIAAGIIDIAENRIQEAQKKYLALRDRPIKFHLVGHLQTNKVKAAIEIFDLIHSVDSVHLAQEIEEQAAKAQKAVDILLQVNVSGEETKFGLNPGEVADLLKEIAGLKHIRVKGLMTIAPLVDNPEKTRSFFRQLRELRDKLNALHLTPYTLRDLSMGMTDDYRVAIEEGATLLRIGRAIFDTQMNTD
ncbi:MAG: YggS family pyridoxal phosphate-dependent enzyme [Candidatus Omnitrophota bacterium]|nr:YggS family pyridoxal phosphate-dependent enzyme [Candidatus Omnitrophota bacterium]